MSGELRNKTCIDRLVSSASGELRNKTCIDRLVSSASSPPNLTLIGNDDFYMNLVWISWCFWVFADISARSSRKKTHILFFICVVLCQGQRFHFSSPNSLKRWRYSLRKVLCVSFGWPSSYVLRVDLFIFFPPSFVFLLYVWSCCLFRLFADSVKFSLLQISRVYSILRSISFVLIALV